MTRSEKAPRHRAAADVAALVVVLVLLAAVAGLLHARALRLWWTNDDFYVLHVLWARTLPEALLSPAVWRQSRMFTPLLLLSFGADLRVFGPRPGPFYAHQLAALAAAAAALYAALRPWLSRGAALLASVLFLCGAPAIAWSQELLVRHYAEGLILAALATRLFVSSLRGGRPALAWASGLLYLGAMLEKEVYVPLPALLLLLPEATPRTPLRRLLPHGIALAGYLAARWALLGTLGGGYGWTIRPRELAGVAAALPAAAARSFLSGGPWDGVLAGALLAGVAAALRRGGKRGAGLLAAALAMALAPVLPVAKAFQPRYAGLAWVAVATAFAFGCAALAARGGRSRPAAVALAAAALVAAVLVQRRAWDARYAVADRMSGEGKSFLAMRGGEYLAHPTIPPAAMHELRWLKEEGLGLPRGAGWFADDLYLCEHAGRIARVRRWDGRARAVVDATSELAFERSLYCASIREAPLEADFSYRDGDFYWELGPYDTGRYAIVYGDGVERFDVARRDGYRHHAAVFALRIRYESPEGWHAYSPEIPLDFRESPRIRWERAARPTS